jgi:hypothetical protein
VSAALKLAGFAAVLALVFASAVLAGGAVGPLRDTSAAAEPHARGMAEMDAETGNVQSVRGLAVSDAGLTLKLARADAETGRPFALAFRIVDRRGQTVRDFDVEHTKRMHLIVVRRDMTGFQHLHPTQQADGSWTVPVALPEAGTYRVFADFSHDGTPRTLADDLQVDGTVRSHVLPAPAQRVTVDGLQVRLTEGASHADAESELGFTVTRSGRRVAVQDYLGAKGHLVALRQGDLAFLHVHPDEDSLKFMATFPTAGNYRLFLQFKVDGRVHTAAFTQEVSR